MISSEVQRTLVKSPPELWAELSDPESLARHLEAFGEIRITRAEPEKLIEWEAERASGSVQIKPSGWGTKVTLSMTRELELEEHSEPACEPAGDGPAETEQPGESDATPADPRDEAEQPAAEEGPVVPEAAVEAEQPAGREYPADAEVLAEPEPVAEPELLAEDEYPGEAEVRWDLDPQGEGVVAEAIEPPAEVEHVKESRRGFFARLFSRLRAQPASHSSSPFEPEAPGTEDAADPWIEAGAELPDAPIEGNLDLSAEPSDAEVAQAPASAIESLQARYAPLEPAEEDFEAPAVEEALQALPEPPSAEEALEASPETSAEVDLVTSESAPQALPPEASAALPTEAAPDLAAELAAAEEVAAEEVTAVLTEVLDRLGAAHHRPFSRA